MDKKSGKTKRSRLQRRIRFCGMTQREISKLTGIKYKTVNQQCLRGIRTPRLARLYANVLNCHPLELLEI